jgi:hypothetical protein
LESVQLSPGEQQLIASIIEHIYPDPKAGSSLPIEHGEMRSARGLERKGLVTIHIREDYGRQVPEMTFSRLGESVYVRLRQQFSNQ